MNDKHNMTLLVPVEFPFDHELMDAQLSRFFPIQIDIILLHVVDTGISDMLHQNELKDADSIFDQMKNNARSRLSEITTKIKSGTVQGMVVEGVPFIEILKLSKDLKVDAIAMKNRSRSDKIETLFFGSTTERVLRGSQLPVFCFPGNV